LESTGWSGVEIPVGLLRAGANEVVFKDGGQLLVEPGRPGRSFKSCDGGQTWSDRQLGRDSDLAGEYLLRLRLGRYASRGWVRTQVVDLTRYTRYMPMTLIKLMQTA